MLLDSINMETALPSPLLCNLQLHKKERRWYADVTERKGGAILIKFFDKKHHNLYIISEYQEAKSK
jgi:hypothetical protein